jgi:Ca2+-transporting ATPase
VHDEAIAVNSTAFEDDEKDTGERVFVRSKMETALLNFAKGLGWPNYKETRDAAQIIQIMPFSGEREAMGAVVKLAHGYCLYIKGTSEILTKLCRCHLHNFEDNVSSFMKWRTPILMLGSLITTTT